MLEDETDAPFADRLTGDVFVTEEDSPGVGKFDAGDASQQRGLSGAGRPEQRDQLARCDVEKNAERKSVVWGKSVSVRVDVGGRRFNEDKKKYTCLVDGSTGHHNKHPLD